MRRLSSALLIAGALLLLTTSAFAQDAPRRARVDLHYHDIGSIKNF
jgi:hypothetical protein